MANAVSLNLVVIRAAELEQARLFYSAIGLQFTRERHGNGPEHLAATVGGLTFEVYPATSESQTVNTRIGFSVPSIGSVLRTLEELGSKIITPPQESPWGLRAVVADPDGHRIELIQSIA